MGFRMVGRFSRKCSGGYVAEAERNHGAENIGSDASGPLNKASRLPRPREPNTP